MPGRYATLAAALATALVAALVPAAGTAQSEPNRRELLFKLNDAIREEVRALELLAKIPPRIQTAALALDRSLAHLSELADAVRGLPRRSPLAQAGSDAADASFYDRKASELLARGDFSEARRWIADTAMYFKSYASGALRPAANPGGSQCADGRDNDGDRLVDARYDSGCANAKDDLERAPLTCNLVLGARGDVYLLQGTCSGPFGKIEITPKGGQLDTRQSPVVRDGRVCYYVSTRRLDCLTKDGTENPRHVVSVRFGPRKGPVIRRTLVTVRDFGGKGRTWTVTLELPAPGEQPFSLGPSAVPATGTFTNGRGGCPVATSFTDSFQFFAPGNGTLTITQPKTGDRVSGPIKPDGSFQLRSSGESYDGKITGNRATATYSYTTSGGCTETFDASFVLQR